MYYLTKSKNIPMKPCFSKQGFFFLITFLNCLICNNVYAASQGKLGIQSSGSIEISVTIHQSLNAISPNEVLLHDNIKNNLTTSKPFCITNHGYDKNASVPYNLIVDRLESYNTDTNNLPFNIFLEDKENKTLLTSGTKLSEQSVLYNNEDMLSNCMATGTKLSIEKKPTVKNTLQPNTTGLLLLLVSPF